MKKQLNFHPFFLFQSAFYQTLMGSFLNITFEPKSKYHEISLPDGDKITMEETFGDNWDKNKSTIVIVHGLCGSHRSPSLVRITRKFVERGYRVIRINLRGCGSGRDLAKKTYHCGISEDIFEALRVIKKETPGSRVILMGYSLGGNIVLKLAGELKENASEFFQEVIALAPPIDLEASVRLFDMPKNKIYLKYFTGLLKEDFEYRKKNNAIYENYFLPPDMNMSDFNRLFIVPFFGFKDVEEYYYKCSSKNVIKDIKVPAKVLISKDDPIISHESFNEISIPENMEVYLTEKGGHLGFLANPKEGFHWLDYLLLDWIGN